MYDMSKPQAVLLKAGDYVRYVPIDECDSIASKALDTDYVPVIREVEVGIYVALNKFEQHSHPRRCHQVCITTDTR